MATSYARMMVRVSLHPAESIYGVVRVGVCTSAAIRRACPLMSERSVNIQSSGVSFGAHGTGEGGTPRVLGRVCRCLPVWEGLPRSRGGVERTCMSRSLLGRAVRVGVSWVTFAGYF